MIAMQIGKRMKSIFMIIFIWKNQTYIKIELMDSIETMLS